MPVHCSLMLHKVLGSNMTLPLHTQTTTSASWHLGPPGFARNQRLDLRGGQQWPRPHWRCQRGLTAWHVGSYWGIPGQTHLAIFFFGHPAEKLPVGHGAFEKNWVETHSSNHEGPSMSGVPSSPGGLFARMARPHPPNRSWTRCSTRWGVASMDREEHRFQIYFSLRVWTWGWVNSYWTHSSKCRTLSTNINHFCVPVHQQCVESKLIVSKSNWKRKSGQSGEFLELQVVFFGAVACVHHFKKSDPSHVESRMRCEMRCSWFSPTSRCQNIKTSATPSVCSRGLYPNSECHKSLPYHFPRTCHRPWQQRRRAAKPRLLEVEHGKAAMLWHAVYGYGSIPINTIFNGMNIHKSQLFWCELQGYQGDTLPYGFPGCWMEFTCIVVSF